VPSGVNAIENIISLCPFRVFRHRPVFISQILIVLSKDPEIRVDMMYFYIFNAFVLLAISIMNAMEIIECH